MTTNGDQRESWDPDAAPDLAPPPPPAHSEQVLVVDGERFRVGEHPRESRHYTYSYDWLTGPNADYGFSSGGPQMATEDHVAAIRDFLDNVDPITGYLSESTNDGDEPTP